MEIGIVLNDVGQNQPAFLAINRANNLLASREHNVTIFYKELSQFFVKFAGLATTIDRMYHFDGALIATNLDLTKFMLRTYTPKKKVLYMFNLDWLVDDKNYLENISIYNSADLFVVVPSEEYKKELFNYSGRVADAVIPRFNLPAIIKVIEDEICNRK